MDKLTLALLAALAAAAVVLGRKRGRLARAAIATAAGLACVWALVAAAVLSGWGDADGFIDCNRHCTSLQQTSGVLFVFAPVVAVLLALLALVVRLRSRSVR